jgi:hypothetical protein
MKAIPNLKLQPRGRPKAAPRRLISLAILLLCAVTIGAIAGPPRTIKYRGGDEGPVVFNHQLHASKGIRCKECHTSFKATGEQLFATRKRGLISFEDHATDTKCFACHNGKVVPAKQPQAPLHDWSHASDDCNHCHYSNNSSAPAAGGDGSIKKGTSDVGQDSNRKMDLPAGVNTNRALLRTSQKTGRVSDN